MDYNCDESNNNINAHAISISNDNNNINAISNSNDNNNNNNHKYIHNHYSIMIQGFVSNGLSPMNDVFIYKPTFKIIIAKLNKELTYYGIPQSYKVVWNAKKIMIYNPKKKFMQNLVKTSIQNEPTNVLFDKKIQSTASLKKEKLLEDIIQQKKVEKKKIPEILNHYINILKQENGESMHDNVIKKIDECKCCLLLCYVYLYMYYVIKTKKKKQKNITHKKKQHSC